ADRESMANLRENAARTDCAVFRAEANRFRSHAMRPVRGGRTPQYPLKMQDSGGRGGIRTHDGVSPMAVFKTAALNRSATLPSLEFVGERLFSLCVSRRFGHQMVTNVRCLGQRPVHHTSRLAAPQRSPASYR